MSPINHVIQINKPHQLKCSALSVAAGADAEIIDLQAGDVVMVEVHGDFEDPLFIDASTGKTFRLPDASYFEYMTP